MPPRNSSPRPIVRLAQRHFPKRDVSALTPKTMIYIPSSSSMRKPLFEFIPSANEEYLTAQSLPQALPELVKRSPMIGSTALLLLFFLAVGLILIAVLLCRSRNGIRHSK